jgi:cysteine desulfurase
MTGNPIYLDHSATTPLDDRVFAAMKPYFSEYFGNPSSIHRYGQKAEAAVEQARSTVAERFGCSSESVFFTACATESNNLVLHGIAAHYAEQDKPFHVLTTPVEHPSVIGPLRTIQEHGQGMYSYLPVDRGGKLRINQLEGLIHDDVSLVSIIFGNNEIGTVNPVHALGRFLSGHTALLHIDAVQCANSMELDVDKLHVDFLTLSAHKFYGPKGVGILYARNPELLKPILQGGSQESGKRPGTHNVPLIVGAAKALELSQSMRDAETERLLPIRDAIIEEVLTGISDCELTGDPEERLPHHISFAFAGVDSNQLLAALDLEGFACSSGSACKVGNPEPSAVLVALGYPEELARGALRVTLGRDSTSEHADGFIHTLIKVIDRLRSGSAS